MRLGKYDEARQQLENIPLNHERTAMAIRHLAHIALKGERFETAGFWLQRGRETYPDSFIDSWVDYAMLEIAVHLGDSAQVEMVRAQAQQKYPPSDQWLGLLNAAAESYEWKASRAENLASRSQTVME